MEDRLLYRTLIYACKTCKQNRYVHLSELEDHELRMREAVFSVMQSNQAKKIFSCGNDSHGIYYYLKESHKTMTYLEIMKEIANLVR